MPKSKTYLQTVYLSDKQPLYRKYTHGRPLTKGLNNALWLEDGCVFWQDLDQTNTPIIIIPLEHVVLMFAEVSK